MLLALVVVPGDEEGGTEEEEEEEGVCATPLSDVAWWRVGVALCPPDPPLVGGEGLLMDMDEGEGFGGGLGLHV